MIKIVLTWVLVPMQMFNIYGAVLASFGAYLTSKYFKYSDDEFTLRVRLNLYEILIKPCYASSIMMFIVLISYNILYKNTISNGISCLTSIFLGMIVYIIMIIVFKVFNVEEIRDRFKRK
ncbi:O-antigen/teichoic acid export membrane protein [Clostridium beijerinckii]|nr:O-antigen/teichoic acid export membrane protein [Clostridium beijerinckii]